MLRKVLKKITPPILLDLKNALFNYDKKKLESNDVLWRGDYQSWKEAESVTVGYDDDSIFKKTAASILKVKNAEAVYERDSVLFDKPEYSWPLLAILLKIAIENAGSLNILDFGGSLGSSYYQNRKFLSGIDRMLWSVVEQERYIDYGNENVADERLRFYYTIDDCIKDRKPHVLLLSGVIQYLRSPYEWLEKFISNDFEYIIFDRTPFIESNADRLTVQEVPEYIYKASYPAWFFNFDKFVKVFTEKYDIVADFDSHHGFVISFENDIKACYKGLILKRKVRRI